MRKVKGFNYDTEKHKHIIAHVDKQANGSQYIWSLVEKDMNQNSIEVLVRQQIEKYLKDLKLDINNPTENIDTGEIMSILNL